MLLWATTQHRAFFAGFANLQLQALNQKITQDWEPADLQELGAAGFQWLHPVTDNYPETCNNSRP